MKSAYLKLALIGSLLLSNSFANEDIDSHQLLKRIEALETRIVVLESRFSFTSFMPDFAERFHVMHRAVDSDDWAVAGHQLQEMMGMVESSTTIDLEKGNLFKAMMGPILKEMEGAIGHSKKEKMATLLPKAVQTCNSCHVATGSPFINVTLDATGSLSMRHPHAFKMQMMGKHTH